MYYNQVGKIASDVLEYDFDFITGGAEKSGELLTISGGLSGRLGQLNVLINQSFYFSGSGGAITPPLQEEEKGILVQIYLKDYYFKEARKMLRSLQAEALTTEPQWTELREGDTTIKRGVFSAKDKVAASKHYQGLAEEADRKITELVYAYNMYGAVPRQVAGDDGYGPACPSDEDETGVIPSGSGIVPSGSGIVPSGSGIVPSGSGIIPSGSGIIPSGSGYYY